jgi:hypothetical protein
MRKIKFRAYDKSGGEVMLDIYAIDFYGRRVKFGVNEEDWRNWDDNNDLILMEFTGLKDKNGVLIYEGDILMETDKAGYVHSGILWGLVTNIEVGKNGCPDLEVFEGKTPKLEIIGNIYEGLHSGENCEKVLEDID